MIQQLLIPLDSDLDTRFKEFDDKNPQIYDKLVDLAYELRDIGHRKIGIGMLFEVIRWQSMIQTEGDHFKMNNSYRSRYVRKITNEHPDLEGMFETRELRS